MFFPDIDAVDKEDANRKLCALIEENQSVPEGFADAFIKRESYGSTDFGDITALAHPFGVVTEQTFAAVGILKNPVNWGKKMIRIVILISMADQVDDYLEEFYQKTSRFMLDRSKPKKLLANPTYDKLLELLKDDQS